MLRNRIRYAYTAGAMDIIKFLLLVNFSGPSKHIYFLPSPFLPANVNFPPFQLTSLFRITLILIRVSLLTVKNRKFRYNRFLAKFAKKKKVLSFPTLL